MKKVCGLCGEDVSDKARSKDPKGRYFCVECYEGLLARKHSRQESAPPAAATAPAAPRAKASTPAESARPAKPSKSAPPARESLAPGAAAPVSELRPSKSSSKSSKPRDADDAPDPNRQSYDLAPDTKPAFESAPKPAAIAAKKVAPVTADGDIPLALED